MTPSKLSAEKVKVIRDNQYLAINAFLDFMLAMCCIKPNETAKINEILRSTNLEKILRDTIRGADAAIQSKKIGATKKLINGLRLVHAQLKTKPSDLDIACLDSVADALGKAGIIVHGRKFNTRSYSTFRNLIEKVKKRHGPDYSKSLGAFLTTMRKTYSGKTKQIVDIGAAATISAVSSTVTPAEDKPSPADIRRNKRAAIPVVDLTEDNTTQTQQPTTSLTTSHPAVHLHQMAQFDFQMPTNSRVPSLQPLDLTIRSKKRERVASTASQSANPSKMPKRSSTETRNDFNQTRQQEDLDDLPIEAYIGFANNAEYDSDGESQVPQVDSDDDALIIDESVTYPLQANTQDDGNGQNSGNTQVENQNNATGTTRNTEQANENANTNDIGNNLSDHHQNQEGQSAPNDEQPPANDEQPPANIDQPPADVEQPPANVEQPPADIEQPPANIDQPAADNENLPPSENQNEQQPPNDEQENPPFDGIAEGVNLQEDGVDLNAAMIASSDSSGPSDSSGSSMNSSENDAIRYGTTINSGRRLPERTRDRPTTDKYRGFQRVIEPGPASIMNISDNPITSLNVPFKNGRLGTVIKACQRLYEKDHMVPTATTVATKYLHGIFYDIGQLVEAADKHTINGVRGPLTQDIESAIRVFYSSIREISDGIKNLLKQEDVTFEHFAQALETYLRANPREADALKQPMTVKGVAPALWEKNALHHEIDSAWEREQLDFAVIISNIESEDEDPKKDYQNAKNIVMFVYYLNKHTRYDAEIAQFLWNRFVPVLYCESNAMLGRASYQNTHCMSAKCQTSGKCHFANNAISFGIIGRIGAFKAMAERLYRNALHGNHRYAFEHASTRCWRRQGNV
ncbi:Oidioi.mRNA.OKI2018_I69.PAR.g13223.t1.cds [Oikopleura dioica]|uniref:Oidioi.mRNA.OKI2018_I69.PAR.g13223.t1.cds n=1 Tax=Oikopleura dioica TaxID=34765 RepID=A0ABN7S797_OIKDI|nr:Oidioi.mRNA.OKI2018_I69.PAR.g13223.t1.cds [Oikopleura dioica]